MPSFRHHDFGDLYIQFDVKFPDKMQIQHENLALLEQVLPPRMPQNPPPADAMVEDHEIDDIDPRQQARAQGGAGFGDDEDDDMHPGAERVQCASQ